MKYKTTFLTVLLVVLLYLSLTLLAKHPPQATAPPPTPQDQAENSQAENSQDAGETARPPAENADNTEGYQEYEDDTYSEEMDTFARLMFERELPKLTEKEKVIWSFRLAKRHTFL